MEKLTKEQKSVDKYIAGFPKEVQSALRSMRRTMQQVLPKAEENISYGIATFKLDGKPVAYFAGFKAHVSLFPATDAMMQAIPQLAPYRASKGTIRFLLKEPLPQGLIKKFTQYRLKEHRKRLIK